MGTNEAMRKLEEFVASRDWDQFHSPENLAKSISIEAAELLENFQWSSDFDREKVLGELADVLTYCYIMAKKLEVEPESLILEKLQETDLKYPIEKSRGNSLKYDKF